MLQALDDGMRVRCSQLRRRCANHISAAVVKNHPVSGSQCASTPHNETSPRLSAVNINVLRMSSRTQQGLLVHSLWTRRLQLHLSGAPSPQLSYQTHVFFLPDRIDLITVWNGDHWNMTAELSDRVFLTKPCRLPMAMELLTHWTMQTGWGTFGCNTSFQTYTLGWRRKGYSNWKVILSQSPPFYWTSSVRDSWLYLKTAYFKGICMTLIK